MVYKLLYEGSADRFLKVYTKLAREGVVVTQDGDT